MGDVSNSFHHNNLIEPAIIYSVQYNGLNRKSLIHLFRLIIFGCQFILIEFELEWLMNRPTPGEKIDPIIKTDFAFGFNLTSSHYRLSYSMITSRLTCIYEKEKKGVISKVIFNMLSCLRNQFQ